jgi:hypothetical protein
MAQMNYISAQRASMAVGVITTVAGLHSFERRERHDPCPLRQPGPDRRRAHPRGQHLTVARRNLHGNSQRRMPWSRNRNPRSR